MYYMMSTVGSWVNDWLTYLSSSTSKPSLMSPSRSRMDGLRVADSLLSELSFQMRNVEDRKREEEQECRRVANGGVDYGWLVMEPTKYYRLSEIEQLDLEDLCCRITPEESGSVIRAFRSAVEPPHEPTVHRLPSILRAVIRQTIDNRPIKQSRGMLALSSEWIGRSIASLRSTRYVRGNMDSDASASNEGDVEMQSCYSIRSSSSEVLVRGGRMPRQSLSYEELHA